MDGRNTWRGWFFISLCEGKGMLEDAQGCTGCIMSTWKWIRLLSVIPETRKTVIRVTREYQGLNWIVRLHWLSHLTDMPRVKCGASLHGLPLNNMNKHSISCEGKYPTGISRREVNPLKPSSYYMYHQACHSFSKVRTHGVFLYFVYTLEKVAIISLSRLKWSVLQLRWRMQTEIQVEPLNKIQVNISLQKG